MRHQAREFEARLLRHEDLLEFGAMASARIQALESRRLGAAIRSSGILAATSSLLAMHETADGNLQAGKLRKSAWPALATNLTHLPAR
jgi:hypothetical protein